MIFWVIFGFSAGYFLLGRKRIIKEIKEYNMRELTKELSSPLDRKLEITSSYGWRSHPVTKARSFHNGIDLRANKDKVFSIHNGYVSKIGNDNISGKYLRVRHYGGYESSYAHLDSIKVKLGDYVGAGQQIGVSGNTGRTTGPHLHFVIRKDGQTIDPAVYLGLKK